MKDRPKILLLENSIGVTGALKSIVQVTRSLQEQFEMVFVVPEKSSVKLFLIENGFHTIYELPMKELRKNFISLILYVPFLILNTFRLQRIIKKESIAVIHGNDIYNLLPVMNRILGNATPYVCHIRFMPDKFPGWLMRTWFYLHERFSYAIIAVSKSVVKKLPPSKKVQVIYDALPTDKQAEKQPGQHTQSFSFLYLSNFMEGKGQNFAIDAFAKIYQLLPSWNLRFVGGDMGLVKNIKYREALKDRARKLGIYEKTEWIGFTNNVEKEYTMADIVLNFSESESFSMTCLETLFYGKPLIASDSGGPAELLEGGQIGILVPNKDIDAMAAAMRDLAMKESERIQMGERASTVVKRKFNVAQTALQLSALYNKMISL